MQKGVDKTASELAIARLTLEIEKTRKMPKMVQEIKSSWINTLTHRYDTRVASMRFGIAHIFVEYENKNPAKLLKLWNLTGFTDDEINSRVNVLSIADTIILQDYFEKTLHSSPNMTQDGKAVLNRLVEDMASLCEMLKAIETLPAKEADLKKHLQTVNQ